MLEMEVKTTEDLVSQREKYEENLRRKSEDEDSKSGEEYDGDDPEFNLDDDEGPKLTPEERLELCKNILTFSYGEFPMHLDFEVCVVNQPEQYESQHEEPLCKQAKT